MEANEAHEHLTLVEGILRRNERQLHAAPFAYIFWAVSGACFYAGYLSGVSPSAASLLFRAGIALSVAALVVSVWAYRVAISDRYSMLDRQAFSALAGITFFMIVMKQVWWSNGLVTGAAFALLWTFGFAVSLLLIGSAGQRALLFGGLILFAGLIIGSIVPQALAISLLVANLAGIGGPGVYALLRRNG